MKKVMLLLISALLVSLSIVSCGKSGPSAKIDGEAAFSGKAGEAFEGKTLTVKLDRTSLKAAIAADASLAGWLDTDAAAELAKLNGTADTDKVTLKASKNAAAGATEIEIKLVGTPTKTTDNDKPVKFSLTIPKDQLKDDEPADALKVSGEISIAVELNAKVSDKTGMKVGVKPKTGNAEDLVFSIEYSLGTASFKVPAASQTEYADGADISSWFGVTEADKVAVTLDGAIKAGDTKFKAKFKMTKENIATLAEDFNKSYTLTIGADKLDNNGGRAITIADAAKVFVYVAADKTSAATMTDIVVTGNVYSPIEQKEVTIRLQNDVFKGYIPKEMTAEDLVLIAAALGLPAEMVAELNQALQVEGVTAIPVPCDSLIGCGSVTVEGLPRPAPIPEGLDVELKADVNAADTEMTLIIKGTPEAIAKNETLSINLPGLFLASGESKSITNGASKFEIKAGAKVDEAEDGKLSLEVWPGLVVDTNIHIQVVGQTFKTSALAKTDVLTIPTAIAQGLTLIGLQMKAETVEEIDGVNMLKVSVKSAPEGIPTSIQPGKHTLPVSGIVVPLSFFNDSDKIDVPVGPLTLEAVIADKFGTTAARKLSVETKDGGNYVERRQANAAHIAGNGIVITAGTGDDAGKTFITINLDCPIAELATDSDLGAGDSTTKKALGIGIKASSKVTDITKLTFNTGAYNPFTAYRFKGDGSNVKPEDAGNDYVDDVYEAKTLCKLGDGEFVLWVDASQVDADKIAKIFTLKADGFEPATYVVKVVETPAKQFNPDVRKLPVTANTTGNYVEMRQVNTDKILDNGITIDDGEAETAYAGKKVITVRLDCLLSTLTKDMNLPTAITSTADAGDHAWIGVGIKPAAEITDIKMLSFNGTKFVGDGTNVKPADAPANYVDDVYEAKTLCGLADGEFVLWLKADAEGVTKEFTLSADGYADTDYIVMIKETKEFDLDAKAIAVTPDAAGNYVERRQVNTDSIADISISDGADEGKTSANPITITVTLDNKVANLAADSDIDASTKTNKIIGIAVQAADAIDDITSLTYKSEGWNSGNAYTFNAQDDVYEAQTLCGLADGWFVLWLNADEIAAATNPAPKKFSLKADGYRETFYQVDIDEPTTEMKYAAIAANGVADGNYVERRQANTKHIRHVGFAEGEVGTPDEGMTIINVYLDCALNALTADDTLDAGTTSHQIIGIGLKPYSNLTNIFGNTNGIYYDGDGDGGVDFVQLQGDGNAAEADPAGNDDEFEAVTLCALPDASYFVLWLNADEIADSTTPAPKYFSLKPSDTSTDVTDYKVVVIPAAN